MSRKTEKKNRIIEGNWNKSAMANGLIERQASNKKQIKTRVMSFTSGKGGVGKTHLVANVAVSLAKSGRSVLIVDADLGLANIDVVMGLAVRSTMHDFLEGRKDLSELIVEGPEGVHIIPASSGMESVLNLTPRERHYLLSAIESVATAYDYLLIDTPAGIGSDVLSFNCASNEIVCVITPEPTSLTDAYALLKVLSRRFGERRIQIVVNNASDQKEANSTFKRFDEVVHRFLAIELEFIGWVPSDKTVRLAVQEQSPFLIQFPSEPASRAVQKIATQIDESFFDYRVKGGMQFFFRQLLEAEQCYGRE